MSDKLMAEWFWTDRWMGSSAFLLPIDARGLYREMLTQAWRRGARLPNDYEAVQRAVGVTKREWDRCWPKVSPYWTVSGESLVNATQQQIYAECLAQSERASDRARKGGQAKAAAQAHAQARAQVGTQAQLAAPTQVVPEHCSLDPDPEEQISVPLIRSGATNDVPVPIRSSSSPLIVSPARYEKAKQSFAFFGDRLKVPHVLNQEFSSKLGKHADLLPGWYHALNDAASATGEAIPDVFEWLRPRFKTWASGLAGGDEMAKFVRGEV